MSTSSDHNSEDEELRERVVSCLTQQLEELELLHSMYPNPGEFVFTEPKVISHVKNFIESRTRTEYVPAHVDFTITLTMGKLKLEVCVDLPSMYPILDEPDMFVRCNQLNRKQQTDLNADMINYMKTIEKGESCIYSMILWLQDNAEKYWMDVNSPIYSSEHVQKASTQQFARYWIYSHHIYNKSKRDEISSNAKEFDLTGFCLPGKPGIICVEGDESDCKEWWRIIKSMTWKKIILRKTEIVKTAAISEERKFKKFEEVHFQNAASKTIRHMDMGRFSKYLEEHGVIGAFNEFFGLCNEQ